MHFIRPSLFRLFAWLALTMAAPAMAQQSPASAASCRIGGFIITPAPYRSVEVRADGRVTFRVCAPAASDVRVTSFDMGDAISFDATGLSGFVLQRDASGLWSGTTAKALAPDNYRYSFVVDGADTADPQATEFSRQRVGAQSTFEIPGAAAAFQTFDPKVPHGVVSVIEYWSASLGMKRRAHVYTPPGYFGSRKRYPVLYLVHGAGDSDDNWTSTGHAHYILDNLLAAGRAKPMIIVMPFGHTPDKPGSDMLANGSFGSDLIGDLIPLIDRDFRTIAKAGARAMAGLSMGGAHTIQHGLTHPELFNYVGIFSMGLDNQAEAERYAVRNAAALQNSAKQMKLVYYAMGKDDFLYATVAPTRAMLDHQGIRHIYNESSGGHAWVNWRSYLRDFLPRLF